jgi:sarcosine oxidase/L-pipecolate oxidase
METTYLQVKREHLHLLMPQLNCHSSILIVGGGTWGCSTALQLVRRGYKNITVLDAHQIPSPISAGNDVNKIMEEGKLSVGIDVSTTS